ncbi:MULTISPECIES: GGDEF domain-containing protein [unclassified Fusibacter]|uniref:GGDEF domain-containing protein n=1 Tax=unclassified Fusibacter TaxID=2624464 RepID=UPI00101021D3|nr:MULTISPECIES: GGDEF domain-containing protein [unclassified Fusibacter]MCK8058942.1 GGDEF domain-containing protein [Fusibacter sp. A2]NPE22018.1 GGDEF domain-containing protein [Fusibacter sp. A1]RXV61583.1 GGDEF domain-containing protein [Fusibacter sp. A1]
MVTSMQGLIDILNHEDSEGRQNMFVQAILESIAVDNDNRIMRDLLFDVVHRNILLYRELEENLKEIKRLSVTDQLTGIFNRRRFIEVLKYEFSRIGRYGIGFSIIMFDIDHFKNVNDTYGHDIGDFVLKKLSELVQSRLRESDTFARWGGEEFMILMPQSTLETALKLSEAIRQLISNFDFSPVTQVTSSFGVINYSDESKIDFEDIISYVDQALYKAKQTGRNRVVAFEKNDSDIESN